MATDVGYARRTGKKSSVHTHLNYLVIVSPPFTPSAASASATVRNLVATRAPDDSHEITKVTVFDLENKLVAYSGTFEEGVREVVSQWGMIYVLGNDGKVSSSPSHFLIHDFINRTVRSSQVSKKNRHPRSLTCSTVNRCTFSL
jgi:hypothetical protein